MLKKSYILNFIIDAKLQIYKMKYLLFLSWDWEAWCLTVWGVILPPERNTALNKGRKCFHCLGAPNNLIPPGSIPGKDKKLFFLLKHPCGL